MGSERGFSLVELVVIMAIIGILLTIGTMNFSTMTRKSGVENEIKKMHSDLMTVRAEAVFKKRERAVKISGTSFAVYSSSSTSGSPVNTLPLGYPVMTSVTVVFDTSGMANDFATPGAVCINKGTEPIVDSIIIGKSMLYMGKKSNGTPCQSENITIK